MEQQGTKTAFASFNQAWNQSLARYQAILYIHKRRAVNRDDSQKYPSHFSCLHFLPVVTVSLSCFIKDFLQFPDILLSLQLTVIYKGQICSKEKEMLKASCVRNVSFFPLNSMNSLNVYLLFTELHFSMCYCFHLPKTILKYSQYLLASVIEYIQLNTKREFQH